MYFNPALIGCNFVTPPGASPPGEATPPYSQPAGAPEVTAKVTARAIEGATVVQTNPPSVPTANAPYSTFLGCLEEAGGNENLDSTFYYDNEQMTATKCKRYCSTGGTTYSSLLWKNDLS